MDKHDEANNRFFFFILRTRLKDGLKLKMSEAGTSERTSVALLDNSSFHKRCTMNIAQRLSVPVPSHFSLLFPVLQVLHGAYS